MDFEWDEAKRLSNLRKHGVDFRRVVEFEWETAVWLEDNRKPYGEQRWLAWGTIGDRLHTLVFTRRGDSTRVISLRKSKRQEVTDYEKATRSPYT